jgi:hypothetical protein
MSRIIRNGSSNVIEQDDFTNPADMRETGGRHRDGHERYAMHEDREAEVDARNSSRAASTDYQWRRPSSLDAPQPRPGMKQRWVRAEFRSENDNLNWQTKSREGWKPRSPSTVPDCESFFGSSTPHLGQSVIRVGGLILMEAPIAMIESKAASIREATRRQEQSVLMETEKVSREGTAQGHAPIERSEQASFTTGRRPRTMAN